MKTTDLFAEVDRYIDGLFAPADAVLEAALQSSIAANLPQIHISASQGKFLYLLAKLCGARRILEIGTLAGYSTIWLARALPAHGRLLSLEYDAGHARLATANIARAGLSGLVTVVVGPALETLGGIAAGDSHPFDMVFIDADKTSYPDYLEWAIRITRPEVSFSPTTWSGKATYSMRTAPMSPFKPRAPSTRSWPPSRASRRSSFNKSASKAMTGWRWQS